MCLCGLFEILIIPVGFYQGEANGKQSKRKQVKMACTNCAAACKRCDEARPCERCIKYGLVDQCQDGVRKERKKGIKRGPYKRKNKSSGSNDGTAFPSYPPQPGNADANGPEWQSTSQPGASPGTASAPATIHAVPQFGPGPPPPGAEGYYPYYYPPPHGFMPPPPPPGQEGHAEGSQAQPGPNAVVQYFSVHPGGYTPFPHYSPYPPQQQPGVPPPPQQHTMDPKKANAAHRQESEEEAEEEEEEESSPVPPTLVPVSVPVPAPSPGPSKKRTRTAKTNGEPRSKKPKTSKKEGKAKTAAKVATNNSRESDDNEPELDTTS